MILQNTYPATESISIVSDISLFAKSMLKAKLVALSKGIFIPDSLINELENYVNRNNLVQNQNLVHSCCPQCLKAHALKTADSFGMEKEAKQFINELFDCESGHLGYYLDCEDLIKF